MPRILLIEDDDTLRRALRLVLEKSGYDVTEAENGREGLAAFVAEPADAVITDIIMPEMEGSDTIRQLRVLSPGVPIIAISGGGRIVAEDCLQIAKMFGATKGLRKPIEIDALLAGLAELPGLASGIGQG